MGNGEPPMALDPELRMEFDTHWKFEKAVEKKADIRVDGD